MMRILSLFTLVCFILTNVFGVVSANTSVLFPSPNINNDINSVVSKHNLFSQYAKITDSVYKDNTPLVIVINDLHNNPQVQQNIEQIINFVSTNSNLDKIILEGAPNKQVLPQLFTSINDNKSVNFIVNNMLSKGEISGAESFVIKNNFKNLYGLENWDIYLQNIKQNPLLKNKYSKEIDILQKSYIDDRINFDRPKLFSLFSQEEPIDKRINELYNFCKHKNIDLSMYSQLTKFVAINKFKNSKDINKEFTKLLNDIKQKVSYKTYQYILNIFKQININTQEKLNLIFYIVKNYSPDLLLKYDLLLSYCNYLEQQTSINKYTLLQELNSLENFLLDNVVDYNQKEIILVDRFVYLLSEYTNLSLSCAQYKYFEQNKNYLYQNSIKYLDTSSIKIISNILKDKDLENYYIVNEKRNKIFYDNISNIININNDTKIESTKKDIIENLKNINSVNVVVVGGFHNQFIDLLKQNNVSVLSVVPIVNKVSSLDNEIIRSENVVYKNALAPPSILVQADINSVASFIDNWKLSMDKSNVPQELQQQAIQKWIQDNNIDVKLSFENDEIKLNDISIKDILKSTTTQESLGQEKSRSKFSRNSNNFIWQLKSFFTKFKTPTKTSLRNIKNFFNKINIVTAFSSTSSEYVSRKLLNERIINNEYQRTLDSLNQKMPDVIVIAVSNQEDIDFCEKILVDIKNHPNFKNTKVQYVIKDKEGTAIGFTKAIQYLNSNNLGKDFKDITSVIIDIDTREKENIGRTDLPMQFNERNITPLELAVLNGIRNSHKFKNGGGISIIDPQSIYIGNMLATGDITFVSSAVNMKEIQNHRHSLVIKDYPDKIRELYYGFQPKNISDIVEKKGIEHKNFYNFDNELMRQFEVVTGNVLISFDTEEKYEKFFDFISDIGTYLENAPEKTNLYQHILIPLLRLNNKSKIESFFAKTMEGRSYQDRQFFNGLAEKINKYYTDSGIGQETKFGVYHQSKSLYSRNFTTQLLTKLRSIFSSTQVQIATENAKSKIKQKPVVIKETFNEDTAIARAYKLLSQIQDKQLNSSVDYEQVYETFIEIFRTTYIQQELYTTENVNTAKLYRYISDIISNTIAQINEEKISNTNKIEQTYLENLKTSFLSMQHYTIEYLRFLDYATNMSTLGSYIFPENSFFEKSKLMPINRAIFGFTRGINKAKKNLREQLATVYSSGNFLVDSLYSYSILRNDVETFISNTENPKQKTSVGMQQQWGNRRAIQRFLSLAIALQSFTTTIVVAMVSSSFSIGILTTAIVSLATGLGISVFLHRGSIFVGWHDKFYKDKKKEIENELQGQTSVKDSIEFFVYDKDKISKMEMIYNNLINYGNMSQKNRMLAKENITLLQQYKKTYDLRLVSTILKNSKTIYNGIDEKDVFKSLLEEFINYLDRINIQDEPKQYEGVGTGFISNTEKTNKEIEKYLTNWLNIIKTNKLNKNSIDSIINNANEIIEITSFDKSKFKGTNKDTLISQLQDFISFYNLTLNLYLQLPLKEQEELNPEIEILEKMYEYAIQYYKSLNYLVSLDILYGYRISKGNKLYFLEQIGIMALVRGIYGIQSGIFLSKKGFMKSIKKVKEIGNEIVNGLYNDKFEKEIENYFKEKENPNYFYLGITESWKDRKMLARFLPLAIFLEKVAKGIVLGTFSFKAFLLSFATGVGLTIALHWIPILSGVFKTAIIKNEKLNISKEEKNSIEQNRQLVLQKHIDDLSNVPYGQMPDLIIIAGTQKRYTTSELNDSIRNIRKHGNLQSVPVEPIITESSGNGNTLLDVFDFIQSKQFVKDYPTLSQKNLEDLRIVVVNVDGAEPSVVNKPLDIEIVDKTTTSIELSLLNAIGMIQQNNNGNGNIVIADPSYMYLGNLTQTDNITLLSSNVTYEQLKSQNLPLLVSDQTEFSKDGSSKIQKLYSSFDDTKISNLAVLHMFNQMYDTDNLSIMQMPTYSGIVGMNFSDKQKLDTLLKFMKVAKEYEQDYKARKFKIDFVQHLLIPLTRLMNNEDLFVYLESLKAPISTVNSKIKEDYDRFFYGLFSKFSDEFKNEISNSFVNVSTTQNALLTRTLKYNSFYKSFVSLLNTLKQFNVGQTIKKITDDIKNVFVSKKKLGLLIVPELTTFSRHQIFAFDNEETNNIAITNFSQLSENKKDSGVIINIPIENTIIPAKVFYDVVTDKKGRNHVVVGFMPVLFDDIDMYSSLRETDILNGILSTESEEVNDIRKKLFLGRATLSFIQELKTNQQLDFIFEDSDFAMSKIDPSYIVSFDDSGLFSVSDIVNDRFATDKEMKKIKHINIATTNKDLVKVPQDYLSQMQLSNLVNEYNVSSDGTINLSLLFRLVSNYNFSFYDSDFSVFLNRPRQYAQNLLNSVFDTKIVRKDFSNISIVPTIDINNFSVKQLEDLLQNMQIDKLVLKNIFDNGTQLFDVSALNISYEIDRLNNADLDKFKNILDDNISLNNNKIFVLNSLLQYVKSNELENNLFQQFINAQTMDFLRDLDFVVAQQISNKEVSQEEIEQIKANNVDKWNYYYDLNMYMQYVAYNHYQDINNLLTSNNIQLVVDYDLENVSLTKLINQINSLYDIYGISNFKLNNVSVHQLQNDTIKYLRTDISDDIMLIFDDVTQEISNYQNIVCISSKDQKDSIAIKPDLSLIENVDDYLTDLSKQEKITTMFIDITDILGDLQSVEKFYQMINLIKNSDSFDYIGYGRELVEKYKDDIISDTSMQQINFVDVSSIDNMNIDNCFNLVYKILLEANINSASYENLIDLIKQLYMQYRYSNDTNKEKIVLELKGILLNIADIQQLAGVSTLTQEIKVDSINALLASA